MSVHRGVLPPGKPPHQRIERRHLDILGQQRLVKTTGQSSLPCAPVHADREQNGVGLTTAVVVAAMHDCRST